MSTPSNPPLAAFLTVVASALVAGTMLLAKLLGTETLGEPLHAFQVSHGRFLFAFLAILFVVALKRPKFESVHYRLHLGRSTLGFAGVTLMFAAATLIPLSDATAISFLNPVVGMLLAIPFLGERIGPWRVLSVAIAFSGAMLLTRPGAGVVEFGALLALAAAVILGCELILIKLLSNRENPLQILFINNLIGCTIATVVVFFVWTAPSLGRWLALAAIGVLMVSAQACFVNAMARAEASFVSPFFYLTLAFSAFYDWLAFSVVPDLISISGAVLILCGAAILIWREAVHKQRLS